jgi:glycosyltransferase involved in cell wall biosynthesis
VIPGDDTHHVSYVHSPPRYLWSNHLPGESAAARMARPLAGPLLQYLRVWDAIAANRVDAYIANSETTAQRIQRRYARSSTVVNPPVEASRLLAIDHQPAGYALSVGELVAYKRVDVAVQAARLAKVPLVVVGDGPERRRLERLADGADVRFVGRVSDTDLDQLWSGASAFIHPGVEDFGIATVEALVAGVPVVGRATGGTAEIVQDGPGVLVPSDDPGEFAEALVRAMSLPVRVPVRHAVAARFGREAFRTAIRNYVEESRSCPSPSSMPQPPNMRMVA